MKAWRILVVLACLGLPLLFNGHAAFGYPCVIPTFAEKGPGVFSYSYELNDPTGSPEDIFDFGLFFNGMPHNIIAPEGWDFISGLGFIDWYSPDPATDLLPGASLSGFYFESTLAPGEVSFTTLGQNVSSGDVGLPFYGNTVGPVAAVSAVPEPSTIMLVFLGFLIVVVGVKVEHANHSDAKIDIAG